MMSGMPGLGQGLDLSQTMDGSLEAGVFHEIGPFHTSANFNAICKF